MYLIPLVVSKLSVHSFGVSNKYNKPMINLIIKLIRSGKQSGNQMSAFVFPEKWWFI